MTTTVTTRFEVVKRQVAKPFVCQACGRKGRKQTTLRQTINPFNRNADGTLKTFSDIHAELQIDAAAWAPEPIHEGCRS